MGTDCNARFNASVICTLEACHAGDHFDIENPTFSWSVGDTDELLNEPIQVEASPSSVHFTIPAHHEDERPIRFTLARLDAEELLDALVVALRPSEKCGQRGCSLVTAHIH